MAPQDAIPNDNRTATEERAPVVSNEKNMWSSKLSIDYVQAQITRRFDHEEYWSMVPAHLNSSVAFLGLLRDCNLSSPDVIMGW